MKLKHIALMIFVFTAACSSVNIDYVGETFSPVKDAKIYFTEKSVPCSYTVIGKAVVRAPISITSKKVQKKLLQTADVKGADGVVILSFKEVPTGCYSYMNYPSLWNMYGGDEFNCSPNGSGPLWNNIYCPGEFDQSKQYYYDYLIKTLFIRFKK